MRSILLILFCATVLRAQPFSAFIDRLERLPRLERDEAVQQYLAAVRTAPVVENDSLVHFIIPAIASTVLVNGDIQGWGFPDTLHRIQCGGFSFFHRSYVVPPDARLDYQLTVDGKTIVDPFNPRITPSGFGPHSEVRMPKFVSTPYLQMRDTVPRGTIDSLMLNAYLPLPLRRFSLAVRPIKVYRPPGYDSLQNLPVLFVQDGFEAVDFARMPVIIDNLIAEKKIVPIIAVFIPPVNRFQEQIGMFRTRYEKFLCHELIPFIDKRYKTATHPAGRALHGISSGANSSLHTAIGNPHIFGIVGGQSATITGELAEIVRRQSSANAIPPAMKIYLDCGRYDLRRADGTNFLSDNRAFSDLLASLRIPHYYREVNDGHQWAGWRERMPEMLIFFFGK